MNRSFLSLHSMLALCTAVSVQASPITYDFNGRFAAPVDGATTFSGSFTYDTNLPLYPNAYQSWRTAIYGDAPGDPGKLINLSFSLGNTSSSNLGTISNTDFSVSHDQTNDGIEINVTFTKDGKESSVEISMANENTKSPGPFTSTAVPSSLSLPQFNLGGRFTYSSSGWISGESPIGTITGLVPAGTPLPPVPEVPEPTTCAVMVLGFSSLLLRRRWPQK